MSIHNLAIECVAAGRDKGVNAPIFHFLRRHPHPLVGTRSLGCEHGVVCGVGFCRLIGCGISGSRRGINRRCSHPACEHLAAYRFGVGRRHNRLALGNSRSLRHFPVHAPCVSVFREFPDGDGARLARGHAAVCGGGGHDGSACGDCGRDEGPNGIGGDICRRFVAVAGCYGQTSLVEILAHKIRCFCGFASDGD